MLSTILAIVITTQSPRPTDRPIVQANTIGVFVPDPTEPPKGQPHGTGTR
jgi:hypothetical protein